MGVSSRIASKELTDARIALADLRRKFEKLEAECKTAQKAVADATVAMSEMQRLYKPFFSLGEGEVRTIEITVALEPRYFKQQSGHTHETQLATAQIAFKSAIEEACRLVLQVCPDVAATASWNIRKGHTEARNRNIILDETQ